MSRILAASFILTLGTAVLAAQTAGRTVQATGSATILAAPDQAQIDAGVVTSAATAQDSAQQNATLTTAVLAAVKAVLGSSGTVQTVSYYVTPRYNTAAGQTNVIVGYTTTNTIRVTTGDLSIIGKLIDAANQAGANSVGNLNFGLQDPEPRVQQALTQATKQAMAHAAAIASGLGATLGPVVTAQEGSSYAPVVVPAATAGGAVSTPVQTGTVSVYASVTVTAQLQ
ncbi:MAG TPA: SIMPL domain-containing protein [Verrucomicrobiae bacterium]|nr:SIMPL domain-containing protein [Verrucomicrobiae bacterium]